MFLFFVSFIAGALTTLAPCTLALLPVIVGGSVGQGQSHKRALVVTTSLGISVILFTLLLKASTLFINVPQTFWTTFSGVIIIIIGLIMLFPVLWENLPFINKMNLSSNRLLATGYQKKNFIGDVIVGAALGPVFSSCSPTYFLILATVLPKSFSAGILYLLAFVFGMCGLLLLITVLSQKAVEKLGFVADSRSWLKRFIGFLFILIGVAIIFGLDQKIELSLSNSFFDVTKVEQVLLNKTATPVADTQTSDKVDVPVVPGQSEVDRIKAKSKMYQKAPEIANPSGFINTPSDQPITLASYVGKKVVLVDFWTYSCINCQRTIPYLNAWYQKYKDQGLEIVSIHTPEFSFEKVLSNVQDGVKRFGIQYPVVLDNDYGTWNAFSNQYWPRDYLIDIDGFVVHDHAGEGDYDGTEQAIQKALAERATILGTGKVATGIVAPKDAVNMDPSLVASPETYFGANRNEYLANGNSHTLGTQQLSLPDTISLNHLYLSGTWNFNSEYAETKDGSAKITYKYNSKDLYFVASSDLGATVKILVDGQPISQDMRGVDVGVDGTANIKENRLYKIIEAKDYAKHTVEIDVINGTLDAYTFTFG